MNIDKVQYNIEDSTINQTDETVIEQLHGKRIDVLTANAEGSNAALLRYYVAKDGGKAVVATAALINAVTLILEADATGAQIGGITVNATDFCMVQLDTGGYQLFDIGSVTPDAPNDELDLGVTAFGGGTGLDAAVAAGSVAYIVRLADVSNITIGAAAVPLENVASGTRGNPLGVTIGESGGGLLHRVNGVALYQQ